MKKPPPSSHLQDLWNAFDKEFESAPPDTMTVYDFMEKYGVTRASAATRLDRGVVNGELESGLFRTKGRKGLVRHYWAKKK